MIDLLVITGLGLLGLVLGSFVGATVWRLRAQQLSQAKAAGESVPKDEWKRLKPLSEQKLRSDRSRCLSCGYQLRWIDLIPLVSWLSLKGKCRNCHKPIGWFEPIVELSMAAFFVASYVFWPYPLSDPLSIAMFVLWLVAGVGLAVLFAYDAKWFLLPDRVNFFVAAVGALSLVLSMTALGNVAESLVNALLSVSVMSGLYFILYTISKGKWIGFGDVKLGIGLGLLLADWQLAFIALFLANLIGCLIVLPLMARGRVTRTTQIPFGPLLIIGTILAKLFGAAIVAWYINLLV